LKRLKLSVGASRLIHSARIAHLATADRSGQPLVVPICFVFNGGEIFSSIDEKPKQSAPRRLRRVRNIAENPQVSLVVDRYDEDWSRLGYILVRGKARVLSKGEKHRKAIRLLRRKYPQYRAMALEDRPVIVIRPARIITWGRF
jgi:PPOX class probable F420-dependent enzyme